MASPSSPYGWIFKLTFGFCRFLIQSASSKNYTGIWEGTSVNKYRSTASGKLTEIKHNGKDSGPQKFEIELRLMAMFNFFIGQGELKYNIDENTAVPTRHKLRCYGFLQEPYLVISYRSYGSICHFGTALLRVPAKNTTADTIEGQSFGTRTNLPYSIISDMKITKVRESVG